jgi:hypothetical protein
MDEADEATAARLRNLGSKRHERVRRRAAP